METELPELFRRRELVAPERFTFHSARMRMTQVTPEALAAMNEQADRCATELADAECDALAYACLVAVMVSGPGAHLRAQDGLSRDQRRLAGRDQRRCARRRCPRRSAPGGSPWSRRTCRASPSGSSAISRTAGSRSSTRSACPSRTTRRSGGWTRPALPELADAPGHQPRRRRRALRVRADAVAGGGAAWSRIGSGCRSSRRRSRRPDSCSTLSGSTRASLAPEHCSPAMARREG